MTRLQKLFSPIRELIQSWHAVDRIRISPNEGRLLRLEVGDNFLLFDDLYIVQQRRVESVGDGYKVVCQLTNSDDNAAQLSVHSTSQQTIRSSLHVGESSRPVVNDDVVLLAANRLQEYQP